MTTQELSTSGATELRSLIEKLEAAEANVINVNLLDSGVDPRIQRFITFNDLMPAIVKNLNLLLEVEFLYAVNKVALDEFIDQNAALKTRLDVCEKQLEVARDGIRNSIARADDYADSYNSQPIREALAEMNRIEEKTK